MILSVKSKKLRVSVGAITNRPFLKKTIIDSFLMFRRWIAASAHEGKLLLTP